MAPPAPVAERPSPGAAPSPARGGARHRSASRALPRFDQALHGAKNDGKKVKFQLGCDCFFADEDGTVEGLILEVDRYMVKILAHCGEVWIGKSATAGAVILT